MRSRKQRRHSDVPGSVNRSASSVISHSTDAASLSSSSAMPRPFNREPVGSRLVPQPSDILALRQVMASALRSLHEVMAFLGDQDAVGGLEHEKSALAQRQAGR